jgi:hypothetical protein
VPVTGVVVTGGAVLARQVVWSSFGMLSPGANNLVPVWESYSGLEYELFSQGGWQLQVAPVPCHKMLSVLSFLESKVIVK